MGTGKLSSCVRVALLSGAIAACGSSGGSGDERADQDAGEDGAATEDAGSSADAGGDAGTEPAFDGVVMRWVDEYKHGDEVFERAVDPFASGRYASATILQDGKTYEGVYDERGFVGFAGVAPGEYWLRLESVASTLFPDDPPGTTWIESSARELDAGGWFTGRPDPALATRESTALRLDVTGMPVLDENGTFEMYSRGVDVLSFAYVGTPGADDPTNPPLPGATSAEGWLWPWGSDACVSGRRGFEPGLLDPRRGDELRINHLALSMPFTSASDTDPWFWATRTTLDATAVLALSAPMRDGKVTEATGTFASVPVKTAELDFKWSSIFELLAAVEHDQEVRCNAMVYLEPYGPVVASDMIPTLGTLDITAPVELGGDGFAVRQPDDRVVKLRYGNPFDFGAEFLSVSCSFGLGRNTPGDDFDLLKGDFSYGGLVGELRGGLPTPAFGFARDLRVNGEPLPGEATLEKVGVRPVLSFDAPTGGTPTSYRVRIWTTKNRLTQSGIDEKRHVVADIRTKRRRIEVPEGVLVEGEPYYFEVTARDGVEPEKLLKTTGSSRGGTTTTYSGVFVP